MRRHQPHGFFIRLAAAFFILHSSFFISSCSDDLTDGYVYSDDDEVADGVYIITRVADNGYGTRASSINTTSSWQGGDFDEVGISSLSVLFFKPVTTTDGDGNTGTDYTLAYAFKTTLPTDTTERDYVTTSTGEKGIRWLVPDWPASTSTTTTMSNYTLSDATTFTTTVSPTAIDDVPSTYTIYAIANHTWGDDDLTIGTTTPADLRKLLTNDDDSAKMAQQPAAARKYGTFEMSDHIVGSESYKDYADEYGVVYRRDYELSLERAVAKICVRVYYTAADASSPTLLTEAGSSSSTDDYDFYNTDHEISFRLVRYAACAPLTDDGTDITTVWSKTSTDNPGKHSLYVQGENAFADPKASNGMLYQHGQSDATWDDACVVFYTYPNNWADSTAIEGTPSFNTTVPIIENRQTYVQMQIKHTPSSTRSVTYTYDIPTNYLLPDFSDATSLTDDQKEELYAAYRIDRNTAYWATIYVEEVEAGLRVACSYGSGSAAAIADIEDDPNVVNLSATSTTVSISDLDDGTGDGQEYTAGDSVLVGYTWTDFSETVDLSNVTSVAFTSTDNNGDSSSGTATFSGGSYTCTGTLMLTSYSDDNNWTAVSSTSYTAATGSNSRRSTGQRIRKADGDGTGDSGDGSGSDTGSGDTGSGDSGSGDGSGGSDSGSGDSGSGDSGGDSSTTTTYTATVSGITCATTYTCSSGSNTLSSTITVTYSISGSDNSSASASVTYTGSSLSSWTEKN